jgi:hypothetical protein
VNLAFIDPISGEKPAHPSQSKLEQDCKSMLERGEAAYFLQKHIFSELSGIYLLNRWNTGRFSAYSAVFSLGCSSRFVETFQTEVSPAVHSRPTSQPEVRLSGFFGE